MTVEARLPYVTHGDGMHIFTDPADGETYVSAYCGMDIAHRVFASFDQNDLKAPISLTVTADPLAARSSAFANVVGWGFPRLALDGEQVATFESALRGDVPTPLRRAWEDEPTTAGDP